MSRLRMLRVWFYMCPACACAESGFTYVPLAHAQSLVLHMSRLCRRRVWLYICPACACAESRFTCVPLAQVQSLVLHMSRLHMRRVLFYICPDCACAESGFTFVLLTHAQRLVFTFNTTFFIHFGPIQNWKNVDYFRIGKKRKGNRNQNAYREF